MKISSKEKNGKIYMGTKNTFYEEDFDLIAEKLTLNVFFTGSKQINFNIIKKLPTNVESIMKETGLTKVPVNNHLNELEKYGLLRREKGTGNVYPTELTDLFKTLIFGIKEHVKINAPKMLSNSIN